jgi:hypothetical protein
VFEKVVHTYDLLVHNDSEVEEPSAAALSQRAIVIQDDIFPKRIKLPSESWS